jgi:glucan biosynthesis protein
LDEILNTGIAKYIPLYPKPQLYVENNIKSDSDNLDINSIQRINYDELKSNWDDQKIRYAIDLKHHISHYFDKEIMYTHIDTYWYIYFLL